MPTGIRDAIVEILEVPPQTSTPSHDSAFVEGHGHGGNGDWSGIGKLQVELFTAAKEPAQPS
jgi:hypothetical protein